MIFPYYNTRHWERFTKRQLDDWIRLHQPKTIEMYDRQYAWLAEMERACITKYDGIPIKFLDATTK